MKTVDSQIIVDAHLDLAMNAMEWNRDLRRTIEEIRLRELGMHDRPDREKGTVSFPAMRQANIGLCVATLIARYVKQKNPLPGWHSPEQAWAQTQGQLAWYRAMEEEGHLVQIRDLDTLKYHLEDWINTTSESPIGYILSLEGADSLVTLDHVERAYQQGLRAIGPAHYGPGTYAQGTDSSGGIGRKGKELLKEMERLNIILDTTHLCDDSFWESLDHFGGPVWASHNNVRSLVLHGRQFSDEQIRELINRNAVIGMVLDAWMLAPNWVRGQSTPESLNITLETAVDHLDHICQLAGDCLHVGIGSDLDGGFGTEQCPGDMNSIADLQKLPSILTMKGYNAEDIENILSKNWVRFLNKAWD